METEIKMKLPVKLASLRKQKGLTQMELAEILNVSRQAISRWEVGTAVPSTDNLKVLSALYGVSVDYLLSDDLDNPNKIDEKQGQMPSVYRKNIKNKKRWLIFVCTAVIVMLVVVATFLSQKTHTMDHAQITQIEDMATERIEDYTKNTFHLE